MTGYRDTYADGAHVVVLDGVVLEFGADGVLWNPTAEQRRVLTADGVRAARFVSFDTDPPGRVVTGSDLLDELVEQQERGAEAVEAGPATDVESAPAPAESAEEATPARRRRRGE